MSILKELSSQYYNVNKQSYLPFKIATVWTCLLNVLLGGVLLYLRVKPHSFYDVYLHRFFLPVVITFTFFNCLFLCMFLNLKTTWRSYEIKQLRLIGFTIEEVSSLFVREALLAIKTIILGTVFVSLTGYIITAILGHIPFLSLLKACGLVIGLNVFLILILIIDLNIVVKEPRERVEKYTKVHNIYIKNFLNHTHYINAIILLAVIGTTGSSFFFTFASSLDAHQYNKMLLKSDCLVTKVDPIIISNFDPDVDLSPKDTLSTPMINKIKKRSEYKTGGAFYYNLDHSIGLETTKLPTTSPVTGDVYPKIKKDTYAFNLYGADSYVLHKMKVLSGHIDEKKLQSGKYIIYGLDYDRRTLLLNDGKADHTKKYFHVGETIHIVRKSKRYSYKIMAICAMNPTVSEERNVVTYGSEVTFYLPVQAYQKIHRDQPRRLLFDTKGDTQSLKRYLRSLHLYSLTRSNVNAYINHAKAFYSVVAAIIYGLFTLIGLLLYVSLISGDLYYYQKELMILRILGMTPSSLKKLILNNSIIHAFVIIFALAITNSLLFWYLSHTFTHVDIFIYHPVYLPTVFCMILIFLSSCLIPLINMKKMSLSGI